MGIISSKLLKFDSKPSKVSAAVQTETPKETMQLPDVRSPTADIIRTPIIVEKLHLEAESLNEYQSFSLRKKLLKTLKLDPRSPTVGIYRTPILVEDTSSNETSPKNFDSPVSIYSYNTNDSLIEVMTPIEPSVNVSGFEIPKEIYCGEFDVTTENYKDKESEESKNCLKVSDQPNTYEAKKLLEEIRSDEENFLKKMKIPLRKTKKGSLKNAEKNTVEAKGKFRSPLCNITSSTNSGNINVGMKHHIRNKVVPEFGSENSACTNIKHLAQWDQNNTVII